MKKSAIADYLFGYDRTAESVDSSRILRFFRSFLGRAAVKTGKGTSGNPYLRSFAQRLSHITKVLAATSVRAYGLGFFAFGLLTVPLCFVKHSFIPGVELSYPSLAIGALLVLLCAPLLFFDTPLGEAPRRVGVIDYVLFELLCLPRPASAANGDTKGLSLLTAAAAGVFFALGGFFLSPEFILATVLGVIFLTLSVISPEFCLMTVTLMIPILPIFAHSSTVLSALTALNLISYLLKVLLGKRAYRFEAYDAALICLMLLYLIGGAFGDIQSFSSSLLFVTLSCGYFLTSNLIRNKRLADNITNLLLLSSSVAAIYGISDFYLSPSIHPEWIDSEVSGEVTARACSTFSNPNVYSVYLLVTVLLSLSLFLDKRRGQFRLFYLVSLLLNLTALMLTYTRGAYIALIVSALTLLVLFAKKASRLLLVPCALLPLAVVFSFSGFGQRLLSSINLSDGSIASRLSIWRSSLAMLSDNFLVGIGVGQNSFTQSFATYAEGGVFAPHSHNLFLQIALEGGIFALVCFLYILILRLRHIVSYHRYTQRSSIRHITWGSAAALVALITFGMTDYILYSPSMLYLFFSILGLGSAALRHSRSEYIESSPHAFADNSGESASISVNILR